MRIVKILRPLMTAPLMLLLASGAHALSGGFGTTTSGGTSSSGSGSVSSCTSIGGSTAGSGLSGGFINISGSGGESCAGEDTDGDRMGNTWEQTYGLNKDNAADRYGDADNDGSSNQREAWMGTKPSGSGSTDTDGDGIADSDDPAPDNAAITTLTVDGTYKGGRIEGSELAE